jgi:drug/metabolite transporter (DMT)-like permease
MDRPFPHRGLLLAPVAVLLVPLWALAGALFLLVIVLFPDGRVPSRRWRWTLWAYAGLVACYLAFSYTKTIVAVAGHRIRLNSAGDVLSTQHLPAWLVVLVLVPIIMLVLAYAVHQVLSWRGGGGAAPPAAEVAGQWRRAAGRHRGRDLAVPAV